MKDIRIFETRIELYPYELGEYPQIESMCSTKYDKATHKKYPIGYFYDKERKTLIIPRGISINMLYQLTGSYPTYHKTISEAKMKYRYKVLVKPKNTDQMKAILFLLSKKYFEKYDRYSQYALTVCPGFGKTYCAIVAALERGMRTIIIVHNNQIKNQWLDTIREKTNMRMDRVLDMSGSETMYQMLEKDVDYDIIITLHASIESYLSRYGYQSTKDLFDHLECGTKIIDEAHLFFKNTLQIDFCSNISKNYYLTATFTRSNRLESDLYALAFSNTLRYGEELGNVKNVIYTIVYYNSNPDEINQSRIKTAHGPSNYRWIKYALTIDKNYTILAAFFHVLEIAKTHPGKTLVIVPKISTCEFFADLIRKEYPDEIVGTTHSKHSKEENLEIQRNSSILISTFGSLGTGADINGLRNLIIMDLYSSEVTAKQITGRLRPLENGEPSYCYELVDSGFESVMTMVRRRERYLKQITKRIEKINF